MQDIKNFQIQGSHECQVIYEGEGCLYKDFARCKKNPGHETFIPIDKFKIGDLPLRYQDNAMLQFVQSLVKLVVRLMVTHTSSNRPEFEFNTNKPYPFFYCRGSETPRTGSGWLREVKMYETLQKGTCSCKGCSFSDTLKAELTIRTAAHIVCDAEEGVHTECCFFYDDGLNVESCNTAHTFSKAIRTVSDIQGDWCDLTFVMCDKCHPEIFARLVEENRELHQKVWSNHPPDKPDKKSAPDEDLNLAIIVSHPHGCAKKISVGSFKLREELAMPDHFTHYTYTTDTCTGSSGAPVFILGRSRRWPWCSHPHSGNCEHDQTLNYSGVGSNEGLGAPTYSAGTVDILRM